MTERNTGSLNLIEQAVLNRISQGEIKGKIHQLAMPYKELMAYYRCAMMQVETKFNVLDEELSLQYDRNPIETIKTRLKTPESIANKLIKKQVPLTAESIEENISDVAGVRVICSFQSDIYMLADALLKQDDITLLKRKDYAWYAMGLSWIVFANCRYSSLFQNSISRAFFFPMVPAFWQGFSRNL